MLIKKFALALVFALASVVSVSSVTASQPAKSDVGSSVKSEPYRGIRCALGKC